MECLKDKVVKEALLGEDITRHFYKEPEKFGCYICGKTVDRFFAIHRGEKRIAYAQRDNRPICARCYGQLAGLDRLITHLFRLFKRGVWR